jgi:hypothetical protein
VIEGLDSLLENKGQPDPTELRALLQELLGESQATGRLIDEQKLRQSRVCCTTMARGGGPGVKYGHGGSRPSRSNLEDLL